MVKPATDDDMPYICMALDAADEISLDTEATGLNVRNGVDYLTGICFSIEGMDGYIPFRHNVDNISKRWVEPLDKIFCTSNISLCAPRETTQKKPPSGSF